MNTKLAQASEAYHLNTTRQTLASLRRHIERLQSTPTDGNWRERAACDRHPTINSASWTDVDRLNKNTDEVQAARRVCILKCPVRAECLAHALNADEREGMWGGQFPWERNPKRGDQ
jgi:hypothetical protein